MAASEELLGKLHDAVASDLLRRVMSGEATPQELSVVVKFLKDNGIEALPVGDSPLNKLAASLPEFTDEEDLHVRH